MRIILKLLAAPLNLFEFHIFIIFHFYMVLQEFYLKNAIFNTFNLHLIFLYYHLVNLNSYVF